MIEKVRSRKTIHLEALDVALNRVVSESKFSLIELKRDSKMLKGKLG